MASELVLKLSLQDLEKLFIDSNGDVNTKLVASVTNEFTKRHLKPLVGIELNNNLKDIVTKVLRDEFKFSIDNGRLLDKKSEVGIKLDEYIKSIIEKLIKSIIDDKIKSYFETMDKSIDEYIEQKCKTELILSIKDNIKEKINRLEL